MPLLLLNQWH